jgi:hypothetical protein
LHSVQRLCCSPSNLIVSAELIAAPWPGEREIFSFGNMASRSSARLENLPLTRNVAAKLSDDKDDSRSFEAGKGKSSRGSLGDKARVGSSDSGNRGDVEPQVNYSLCMILNGHGAYARCFLLIHASQHIRSSCTLAWGNCIMNHPFSRT